MNAKKELTVWQAACIVTGYGLGAGVLSMPILAQTNGLPVALVLLVLSLIASYVLHLMIAELAIRNGGNGQVITCLSRFLWRGKWEKPLTILFFVLMAGILLSNLAAYISGAEEVIVSLLPVTPLAAKLLFYVLAAAVVLFGLKAVGISESIAVSVIFGLVAVLAAASLVNIRNPLPMAPGSAGQALAYFGMAMFAMSAFFSVPQAVVGLNGDLKKVRKAVFLGIFNNFVLILAVTLCALLASTEVTEVAMVGWSQGIGLWAQILGSGFTILAMLTTYWSLSLALGDMIADLLKTDTRVSWLAATLPSLLLALANLSGFMELMRTAGGLIAIVIAFMVVPAFRNARRETRHAPLLKRGGTAVQAAIIAAYLLMAVGSVVPV